MGPLASFKPKEGGHSDADSACSVFAESLFQVQASVLRPCATWGRLSGFNEFWETDTFSQSFRLVCGLEANAADRDAKMRVARGAAFGAGEIFWMSLIAVLIAWSVSPSANRSHRLTGSSWGCVFVGKGGVICNRSATAAQKIASESVDACLSFGRGGHYCPPAK